MFSYLASPYTARNPDGSPNLELEHHRFELAMDCVCWLLSHRGTVYSPIIHFHPIATTHNLPTDIQFWRNHNLNMLLEARELLVLQIAGWDSSSGVRWEIEHARGNNTPMHYLVPKVEAGQGCDFDVKAFP